MENSVADHVYPDQAITPNDTSSKNQDDSVPKEINEFLKSDSYT